jgi:hypothetical protein
MRGDWSYPRLPGKILRITFAALRAISLSRGALPVASHPAQIRGGFRKSMFICADLRLNSQFAYDFFLQPSNHCG